MRRSPTRNNLSPEFEALVRELRATSPISIDSMYVIGSALTDDFIPGKSDINSIILIETITQPFLAYLVQLGGRYREKQIAAPLVMTLEYIRSSLDTFPIEFFNIQTNHLTMFGQDRFSDLVLPPDKLGLQCEREIRSRLLWLGQAYLESLGEKKPLLERIIAINAGMMPLFQALLFFADKEIPVIFHALCQDVRKITGVDMEIFSAIRKLKNMDLEGEEENAYDYFNRYYEATEQLVCYIDAMVS